MKLLFKFSSFHFILKWKVVFKWKPESDFFLGRVSAGVFAGISSAAEFFFDSNVSAEECLSVLGVCACRRWDSSAQIKWECYPQLRDCLPGPLLPVNRCSLDSSRTNVSRQGRVWKYAHMLFKVQQDTSGWYRRMICNSTENIWLYLKAFLSVLW